MMNAMGRPRKGSTFSRKGVYEGPHPRRQRPARNQPRRTGETRSRPGLSPTPPKRTQPDWLKPTKKLTELERYAMRSYKIQKVLREWEDGYANGERTPGELAVEIYNNNFNPLAEGLKLGFQLGQYSSSYMAENEPGTWNFASNGWITKCDERQRPAPFGYRGTVVSTNQNEGTCAATFNAPAGLVQDINDPNYSFMWNGQQIRSIRLETWANAARTRVSHDWVVARPTSTSNPWKKPDYIPGRAVYKALIVPMPMVLPVRPRPDTTPRFARARNLKPYERPALVISTAGGRPRLSFGSHALRRPGKGEKEVKGKWPAGLSGLISVATDYADIVKAANKSLPKNKQYRGKDVLGMSAHVYRNAQHMDIPTFIKELIQNEVEDRVIGALASQKGAKEAFRKYKWLAGPAAGPAI